MMFLHRSTPIVVEKLKNSLGISIMEYERIFKYSEKVELFAVFMDITIDCFGIDVAEVLD